MPKIAGDLVLVQRAFPTTNPDAGFIEIFADSEVGGKPSVIYPTGQKFPLVEDDGSLLRTAQLVGGSAASIYTPDQEIINAGGA